MLSVSLDNNRYDFKTADQRFNVKFYLAIGVCHDVRFICKGSCAPQNSNSLKKILFFSHFTPIIFVGLTQACFQARSGKI